MGELNQVADGVWVRQSESVWTNSIVVRVDEGLILVDPGIHGHELDQLANDLEQLALPVVTGVLIAGDMLSDILIPILDSRQEDQLGAYETALERLEAVAGDVDVAIPGHGAVAKGPEVAARITAERAYIEALRQGVDPVDARLEQDWVVGIHESNLRQSRA